MKPRGNAARYLAMTDAEHIARIKAKCTVNDRGCWIWNGYKNRWGYGETSYRGDSYMTHRLMYQLCVGPIPPDGDHGRTIICHTCDAPACVNPLHLWVGTEQQNMRDAGRKKRWSRQHLTHCPRGHAYDEGNTYLYRKPGGRAARNCKTCSRIRQRVAAGWTREQAEKLPTTSPGQRPVNATGHRRKRRYAHQSTAVHHE